MENGYLANEQAKSSPDDVPGDLGRGSAESNVEQRYLMLTWSSPG